MTQLDIFDAATEPSRTTGTCAGCSQSVTLRAPVNNAPYPALTLPHDLKATGRRGEALRCMEMHQVPREWQAWLQADPERWSAYQAEFQAWLREVGLA